MSRGKRRNTNIDPKIIKADLDFQKSVNRYSYISRTVTAIFRNITRLGIVWIVMYYLYLSVVAVSGKDTNFFVKLIADLSINESLAYIIAIMGLGYGGAERILRKKHVKRSTKRISELERQLNPERKSSGLTFEGNTAKGDIENV